MILERPSSRNEDDDRRGGKRGCCSNCNSQIFCSYVLALIATGLVVGGVYLTVLYWDHVWLIFSALGLVLIFVGSCMYYCGVQALRKRYCDDDLIEYGSNRRRRQKRFRDRGLSGDELVPSAPQMGDSSSQLSLNMIPQYFTTSRGDGSNQPTSTSQPGPMAFNQNGQSCGQIFQINGQSFLILPLTSTDSVTLSLQEASLNGLVVRMPTDKESEQRKNDFVDFLNQPPKLDAEQQLSKRVEAGGDGGGTSTSDDSGPSSETELMQQSTSGLLHQSQLYDNLPTRGHNEGINLAVLSSSEKKSGLLGKHRKLVGSEGTSAPGRPTRNNQTDSPTLPSVNSTSYFVSFRNSTNSPTITPRARTTTTAAANERNNAASGSANNASNRTSSVAAAPRSSVRRQATFKQVKPTVISVLPTTSGNSQPSAAADAGSSSSSSQNDSAILIELESPGTSSTTMTISASGSTNPPTSFHDDLYNDDDEDADIDTNEDESSSTPPPPYDQALELDEPIQYVTVSNQTSESNQARGSM